MMRGEMHGAVLTGLCGALTTLALVALAGAGPAAISPSELLADPDRFDGQVVALQGTVEKLREKVSPDGAPYFKFRLSDGPSAVRVFSPGRSPCRNGMQGRLSTQEICDSCPLAAPRLFRRHSCSRGRHQGSP